MRNQRYLPEFLSVLHEVDDFLLRSELDPVHRRLMQQSLDPLRQDFFADKLVAALIFPALTREALGQKPARCFTQLAAVHVLFYGFLDLTDDVEDRELSGMLWQELGESVAINTGASLLFLSLNLLHELEAPVPVRLDLFRQFSEAGYFLTVGQQRDLLSSRWPDQGVESVLQTHLLKTGSSVALYLRSTASLAGATPEQCEGFEALGQSLGILAQILGDWRDTEQGGADFINGCESVPLQILRARLRAEDALFLSRLQEQAREPGNPLPLAMYRHLLQKYGVREAVAQLMHDYQERAASCVQQLAKSGVNTTLFLPFLERLAHL